MGFNDQQNKRISNFIIDELRLNPVSDDIPKKVNNSIQPTFEVNRKIAKVLGTATRVVTGTATIFTTATNVDTYVTSVSLSLNKDATHDGAIGAMATIQSSISGNSVALASIGGLTLTAQSTDKVVHFNPPIKLDRGVVVQIGGQSYTAGLATRVATVIGYEQETGDVTPA